MADYEMWLTLGGKAYTRGDLFAIANDDRGLCERAEAAAEEVNSGQLWTPHAWDHGPISTPAERAPGSERRNDVTFFFEQFDQIIRHSYVSLVNSLLQFQAPRGGVVVSGTFDQVDDDLYEPYTGPPGRKITAAPEGDDEEMQPGFEGTWQPDVSYLDEKPGTPEHNAAAREWIDRESWHRQLNHRTERDSRAMVRDANLKRYAMNDTDRLIEEMME